MNTDPEIRAKTQERAEELNDVYEKILADTTWNNFDTMWHRDIVSWILENLPADKEPWQIIEAVDGFHPNLTGNKILAELMWEKINNEHPEWIGPRNPYNSLLEQMSD